MDACYKKIGNILIPCKSQLTLSIPHSFFFFCSLRAVRPKIDQAPSTGVYNLPPELWELVNLHYDVPIKVLCRVAQVSSFPHFYFLTFKTGKYFYFLVWTQLVRRLSLPTDRFKEVSVFPMLERTPKLQWLELSDLSTDTSCISLLTDLTSLHFSCTKSWSIDIVSSLTKLNNLVFTPQKILSPRGPDQRPIFTTLQNLTNLQRLVIQGSTGWMEDLMGELNPVASLKELNFGTYGVSWTTLQNCFSNKSRLVDLKLEWNDDTPLAPNFQKFEFVGLEGLKSLRLSGGTLLIVEKISNSLTNLVNLELPRFRKGLKDEIFFYLVKLTQLQSLDLSGQYIFSHPP